MDFPFLTGPVPAGGVTLPRIPGIPTVISLRLQMV